MAIVDHAPVITVRIEPEGNNLAWPVHFDGTNVSVPRVASAITLALDARGHVARARTLIGSSAGGMGMGTGVKRASVTAGGGRTWLVVEHRDALAYNGHAYPVATSEQAIELLPAIH